MSQQLTKLKQYAFNVMAVILCVFVLLGVNRDLLAGFLPSWFGTIVPGDDQPKLALFAMLGLVLVFLSFPMFKRWRSNAFLQILDLGLVAAAVVTFGYIFVQSENLFEQFWVEGQMLGARASSEQPYELVIGAIGILLIFEATRRAIGLTLPLLCLAFVLYAFFGQSMPDWLFPHRGLSWQQISQGAFVQSGTMCVFGIALNVMFKYVFLFVLFGTLLEQTGATGYIINFARRLFRNSVGGPAKVAVVSSGLMGSLSGSAVANTATTGSFTIPLMKSTGFDSESAAGVEAAASTGGALMPPIMGAGAYMMLEILGPLDPEITYLKIVKAALIPAVLYYTALLLAVHFHAKKIGAQSEVGHSEDVSDHSSESDEPGSRNTIFQGFVFFGSFIILIAMLLRGYTPFLAVSVSLIGICLLACFSESTRIGPAEIVKAMLSAAKSGTSLIVAASCVGIILGAVSMSGLGPALPAKVQLLAGDSALLALLLLMTSTIVLGMGLPSAVCYLLVALTVSNVLSVLDTPPLAAHLFIFYFGMMSMVTPPVALAAYAGAAIAKADVMRSAFAAFRFALVGFALPFAFVLSPELIMLTPENTPASFVTVAASVGLTLVAILGLAVGIAGFAFKPLNVAIRFVLIAVSLVVFFCRLQGVELIIQIAATALVLFLVGSNFATRGPDLKKG